MRPGVIPEGGVGADRGTGQALCASVRVFLPESAFRPLCPFVR